MMKDDRNAHFDTGRKVRVATVQLGTDRSNELRIGLDAAEACSRFWRAAESIPEGGCIGWQLTAEQDKKWQAAIFFSEEVSATREDFAWIFRNCGQIGEFREEILSLPENQNLTFYALRDRAGADAAEDHCKNQDREGLAYNLRERLNYSPNSHIAELLEGLNTAGAVLRFTACGGSNEQGMILVCLNGAMSLRLRTLFALAFPGTGIEEVSGPDAAAFLRPAYMLDAMLGALWTILYSEGDERRENQASGNNSVSIERLNLSMRSYNCLKRAGIDTTEQLLALRDEDYRNIRHLTQKCVAEIRQKLADFQGHPAAGRETGALQQLEELIGLRNVKEQMRKVAALANMKQDMRSRDMGGIPVTLNMAFVGNPGTAKTTVARIAAAIFHEAGLLSSGEPVEVGRADLVARYVGQTAPKVKQIFEEARGKLLFVDEAYALVEGKGLYGDEAINTIVAEMENHREETIVVFAGYPEEMDAFFSKNPGLRSRVPFQIHFPDYSAGEMVQIAELEAKKRGFSILPETRDTVLSVCEAAIRRPDAGNGRFCRNLVENAILNYAVRVYGSDQSGTDGKFVLTDVDFSAPAGAEETEPVRRIGFCA